MTLSNTVVTTDLVVDHRTRHASVRALVHPAMTVPGGTSVAVMGPSGCGKSTLLGLLAGLAVPTSGSIIVGTTELSALAEPDRARFRRAHLGMVYQADNLLPHLTAEENVALAVSVSPVAIRPVATSPVAIRPVGHDAAPNELLARLGMSDLGARFPDQLSGGQRQRVAVARAVAHHPEVILADEPTGALDRANAVGVIELLVGIQRAIGATLIVVTHDPAIAEHADHTLHMIAIGSREGVARVG